MHRLLYADCSIRKSADRSSLTAPRSLSQLTTSFIGSQCQGIHSALFIALPFVPGSIFAFSWIFTRCSFFTRLEILLSCRSIYLLVVPHLHFAFFYSLFKLPSALFFKNRFQSTSFCLSTEIYSWCELFQFLLLLFFRKEHDTLRVFVAVFCNSQRYSVFFCLLFFFREKKSKWWAQMDSNHRPHAYQACALTTWAMRPFWWRWGGSNSWPPACKAGALPAELHPHLLVSSKLNNASLLQLLPLLTGVMLFKHSP